MTARVRLAIIGSGAGTTADSVVAAVAEGTVCAVVALVISNNSTSGITEVAKRSGIPSLHLSSVTHPEDDDRDAAMLTALTEAGVDLIVLAGYMKKIGPRVLAAYQGRIVNTHPALLPAYGSTGMYGDRVHAAVLRDKAETTGATIHAVNENYDEGPILAQVSVDVLPDDDIASLRERVQTAEKALLTRWLHDWTFRFEHSSPRTG